ncbi:MAG: BLUF domain-containing protein [Pseudohongiellaceae bacterium]
MEEIYRVIYVSSASNLMQEEQLIDILKSSQPRNAAADITGLLLYKEGNIIQALEGPKDNVQKLVSKIKSDNRHHGVIELLQETSGERHFPNWSMDYGNVSKDTEVGFSDFLHPDQSEQEEEICAGSAKKLMLNFKKYM